MMIIGITGGVGAGKSAILEYLSGKEGIRVMLADEIAHDLMEPGTECYRKLEQEFKTEDIFLKEPELLPLNSPPNRFPWERERSSRATVLSFQIGEMQAPPRRSAWVGTPYGYPYQWQVLLPFPADDPNGLPADTPYRA